MNAKKKKKSTGIQFIKNKYLDEITTIMQWQQYNRLLLMIVFIQKNFNVNLILSPNYLHQTIYPFFDKNFNCNDATVFMASGICLTYYSNLLFISLLPEFILISKLLHDQYCSCKGPDQNKGVDVPNYRTSVGPCTA